MYRTGEWKQAETQTSENREIAEDYFEAAGRQDTDLVIPLPDAQSAYQLQESIRDETLQIILEKCEEDFYIQNKIRGNEEKITGVRYLQSGAQTTLTFALNGVYEAQVDRQQDGLHITLVSPLNEYDKIVVFGGSVWEQEDADQLQEEGVKCFLSGDVQSANALRAELYVELTQGKFPIVETQGDGPQIVIYTSDAYVIPGFDSADLAQLLQEKLSERFVKAEVLVCESDDADLADAMIPAVKVVCSETSAQEKSVTSPEDVVTEAYVKGKILSVLTDYFEEMEEEQ
jgi:hypothetical protein